MTCVGLQYIPSCSMQLQQQEPQQRQLKQQKNNNTCDQQQQKSYKNSFKTTTMSNQYDTVFVENTVALAVINRLHRWCCQLFWLTIICVVTCCGELHKERTETLANVRRTIINNAQRRRKVVSDMEMQVNFFKINFSLKGSNPFSNQD